MGIYTHHEIISHRAGPDGGIAELATIVARDECAAVILFLDPSDPWADAVENRALKRVCIQKQIRLITTIAAAIRWAKYEASALVIAQTDPAQTQPKWKPKNWEAGNKNLTERSEFLPLKVSLRSIALISHDKKKLEMVQFVNNHLSLLAQHHRIITTGTTGWLLKLLYSSQTQQSAFLDEVRNAQREDRLIKIIEELLELMPSRGTLGLLLDRLRKHLNITTNEEFTNKVMPLPSGPDGGDVLMANEVLDNRCHTIIFFHDPMTAHPHNDDIRLLEHTSQLPGVFAECVSDRRSAEEWVKGLTKELGNDNEPLNVAQALRQRHNLLEAIVVEVEDDTDSDKLGEALARACAGYFHQRLLATMSEGKETRIGVAWGWTARQVLIELKKMEQEGFLQKPARLLGKVVWSPLIGHITVVLTEREATAIADQYRNYYGGELEAFKSSGLVQGDIASASLPLDDKKLMENLKQSDLIIISAAPWNNDSTFYQNTALSREYFPAPSAAEGNVSVIFLDKDGGEVKQHYSAVGLGYEGFQEAAKNGAVIFVCGGIAHRGIALA
jgi:methylglyoxal synthase